MGDITRNDWRAAGACTSEDPDLFFPISEREAGARQAQRALRICAGCPVRRQCLEFALRTRNKDGIWGGTTAEERIRALRGPTTPASLYQRTQRSGLLAS